MQKVVRSVLQDARNRPLAYIVQVVGLLVIFANMWIASRLAPLAQDVLVIQQQVKAIQEQIATEDYIPREEYESRHQVLIDSINKLDKDVVTRLDRIESKLDRHIEQ